jgi:hypothetical protein
MQRPSAEEVLACDWMKKADEVTEAEVVAAFERRRPVSEEAHNTMSVTCAPRLKDTATAFAALIESLQSLEWPTAGNDVRAEVHVDKDRLTATCVMDEMRIRAILTPVEGLLEKNPTVNMFAHGDAVAGEADPVAAAKRMEAVRLEREMNQTPVVRLVWIGGSAGAMQLVNVYMAVSAMLST